MAAADESLLAWQVSIGPKSYPESSPSTNLAETFGLLQQALGIYDESIRTPSIRDGVPTESVLHRGPAANRRRALLVCVDSFGRPSHNQAQQHGHRRQAGWEGLCPYDRGGDP